MSFSVDTETFGVTVALHFGGTHDATYMPQTLNEQWRKMLGERAEEIHTQWLHTVGNLTLSGYNPDMSNKPFEEKKVILRDSHLELNRDIVACDVWDEGTLKIRAAMLADKALAIWKRG